MSSFTGALGTLFVEIDARADDALAAFDQIEGAVDDMQEKFAGMEKVGQQMAGIGAGLTAAVTLPLVGVGAAAVKTAEDLNIAKLSFTTMLGSAEAAEKMLKDLQQFAQTTPFEFPDLVASAKNMKAMGFEASQVIPTLKTVGDTAAALGGGKDVIDGITRALGQMQAKGKVSAEEMNQLAERGIPAWKILADQIGVSIPQAMKMAEKGAIAASTAVPALLEGMNKAFGGQMEQMSKTLTGQWSNLKDTLTAALIPIGQALIPALQALMPILQSVTGGIAEIAKYFQQLPGPVQAAIGTIALLAAALGPVLLALGGITTAIAAAMPALTGLAGFFGVSVAALAPWALAIGAVLAALVALGVWVKDNWEPIVAVLKTAWEGLTEAWTATWSAVSSFVIGIWEKIAGSGKSIWEPIAKFFSTVWDGIAGYFQSAWNTIAGFLDSIWGSIKSVATKAWDAVSEAIAGFLKWVEKIPGAKKLLNLDDTWQSAQKAAAELNKTAAATENVGKKAEASGKKIAAFGEENDKAIKKAAKHAELVRDAWDAAHKRYEQMATEAEKTRKWFEESYAKLDALNKQVAKSATDLANDYARAHEAMRAEATKTVGIMVPLSERIPKPVQDAIKANKDLEQAYKDLGVTSADELNKHYGKAKEAYDKITASGTASAADIDKAWVAMEKARQAAATAAGETIPADQKKMLEKMEEQTSTSSKKQKDAWADFSKEVSTVITNFAQDIAKSLFDGDLSFGEKAKKMLSSLGEAVTAKFIEPATKAVSEFITGVLTDLLSGKGLGGVMDSLKGIGSAMSGIFGGGASAASGAAGAAGDIAGAAGGAGSSAAGAAGAAVGAGIQGIVGVVSGVVSAVSGVISNFQFAAMNKSLDLIERYTRRSEIHLQYILEDGVNKWLPKLDQINGFLWDTFIGAFASLMSTTEEIRDIVKSLKFPIDWTMNFVDMNRQTLYEIRDALYDIRGYLETTRDNTGTMRDKLTGAQTWTVQFTGDPVASLVGQEIMRQLRLQGVNLV